MHGLCHLIDEPLLAAMQIIKPHKAICFAGILGPEQGVFRHVCQDVRSRGLRWVFVVDQDKIIPRLPPLVGPIACPRAGRRGLSGRPRSIQVRGAGDMAVGPDVIQNEVEAETDIQLVRDVD